MVASFLLPGREQVSRFVLALGRTEICPTRDGASVVATLPSYLDARKRAGASTMPDAALFWHQRCAGRYARATAEQLLVGVLRRAGLKPKPGRTGPSHP